jgi:hypothetical protein
LIFEVVVAIVDEASFFPCLETIIARMSHITANLARHVRIHNLGGFHVASCLQFLHEEVHLGSDHVDSIDLVYTEDHVWFEDRWMVASLCDE